ncbi:MAG: type II secretion system protein GspM [Burkholderiales bacterium]|nr:type II secretion system protein GspM [Burkholderiales bacterium]
MNRSASIADWKIQVLARADQLWATHGQSRWQGLNARERLLVSVFFGLFGIWLFVSIAISPALRTLNSAQQQRAEVAQQVVQMRALQQRAQELQKTKPLSRDESLRSLQSITPAGNPALQMTIQGDRVMVQLKNLSASQLATWLAQARSNAQALPDEVHISRSATSSVSSSTSVSALSGVNVTSNSTNATTAWDGQIILRLPQRSANQASSSVNANVSGARP